MSVAVNMRVKDFATPAVQAMIADLQPARLLKPVGEDLTRLTQRHLLANGKNKRGWPTTNFWARAATPAFEINSDYLVTLIGEQGSEIWYTVQAPLVAGSPDDFKFPSRTGGGVPYVEPFTVEAGNTLYYAAWQNGRLPSHVETQLIT
jgi:hypothetical protein